MNKFCGKCGAELVEGGKFCESCGNPLDGQASAPTKPNALRLVIKKQLIISVALLAVGVLLWIPFQAYSANAEAYKYLGGFALTLLIANIFIATVLYLRNET